MKEFIFRGLADTYRSLLGRRVRRGHTRQRGARSLYLGAAAVGVGAMLSLQAVVTIVDPFNLYPWSPSRAIPDQAQSDKLSMYLLRVAAKDNYDTVIAGGSTVLDFRAKDVEAYLPGVVRAVNLAYPMTEPGDLAVTLGEVSRMPNVRHVLIPLDYVYMMPTTFRFAAFPYKLYNNKLGNRFLAADRVAVQLSFNLLLKGKLSARGSEHDDYEVEVRNLYARTHSLQGIESLKEASTRSHAAMAEPAALDCHDFPALMQEFVPFAEAMSRQGKTVDVLVPPYSFSFYTFLIDHPVFYKPRPTLDAHIALRRCAVSQLANLPNVRVFAFDDEPWLVEDEANFFDPGHVYHPENYRYMLGEIAAGRHQLTPANFDAYADSLRRRVLNYSYHSTDLKDAGG